MLRRRCSQPGVHRLALQGEDGERALVDAVQRLAVHETLQGLDVVGVEGAERVGEEVRGRSVDGVASFRPGQQHGRDRTVFDHIHRHRPSVVRGSGL